MLTGIRFDEYGPFTDGADLQLAPNITLIVGRNNSGKSLLVDLLCDACGSALARPGCPSASNLRLGIRLDKHHIGKAFAPGVHGNMVRAPSTAARVEANGLVGKTLWVKQREGSPLHSLSAKENGTAFSHQTNRAYGDRLASQMVESLRGRGKQGYARRLSAERDITPEAAAKDKLPRLAKNGAGASALVQAILTRSDQDEALIEQKLLSALNEIMAPDSRFDSVRAQSSRTDDGLRWEIFLSKEGQPRRALSSMGSGLKTVVLVLLSLFAVDGAKNPEMKTELFLFEELENNLHPSLLRRLIGYLRDYSFRTGSRIVLTSHSHVVINAVFGEEGCSVYQVVPSGEGSRLDKVKSRDDTMQVLDDLGIQASDLFQTNGIIWVEGPSDRVYIKAWLELLSGRKLEEGLHYSFLYYGGRLLSHYTAEQTAGLIDFMLVNRNAIVVMDSDVAEEGKRPNATKQRVRKELHSHGVGYWITQGREIENYLSQRALTAEFGGKAPSRQVGRYEKFPDYIAGAFSGFASDKVGFARRVAARFTPDDLDVLDLRARIEAVRADIEKWNGR